MIHMHRTVHGFALKRSIKGWHGRIGHFDVVFYKLPEFTGWFAKYHRAPGSFCQAGTLGELVMDVSMHLEPDNRGETR